MSSQVDLAEVLEQAKPVIVDRYTRMLSSISHRFDVDDLYQATCFRACRSIQRCQGSTPEEVHNWVMKIAANACRTAITAHKVSKIRSTRVEKLSVGVVDKDVDSSIDPADEDVDMNADALIREECRHMLACIDRLPRQRQHVLRMRYLECKSYKEIAAELDITETAARTSLSQALSDARSEVSQYSLPGFE